MFTKDSVMVKYWVRLIQLGTFSMEQVPALSNLQETVASALDENQV